MPAFLFLVAIMENHYLKVALDAAKEAGSLLMEYFGKLRPGQIHSKGKCDLVTDADYRSEELIVAKILSHFPGHAILAEEQTDKTGTEPFKWFVDPLDGTVNYAHRHPFFAVSIAMARKEKMEIGVIYAPCLDELFYAVKGQGAYRRRQGHEEKIHVSSIDDISQSLLATGFAYKRTKDYPDALNKLFIDFLGKCQDIRRCGAAALDLCYVADGRYDGFWEWGLCPHDVAAGGLIVEEAGGKTCNWQGEGDYLWSKNLLAANSELYATMLAEVAHS